MQVLALQTRGVNTVSATEPLSGGNSAPVIYRQGNVVYKSSHESTPAVGRLLRYLEQRAPGLTPRFSGVGDDGLQRLEYIPGHLLADQGRLSDTALRDAGAAIRELHDALESYKPNAMDRFYPSFPTEAGSILCHNDLSPWNFILRPDGSMCIIDWDGVGWGTREWDLGYAIKTFVGLEPGTGVANNGIRMCIFLDGYRWSGSPDLILSNVLLRTESMRDLLETGKRNNTPPWSRLYDEGHWGYWSDCYDYIASNMEHWRAPLFRRGIE
ncbi:phosphotransferase [Clavibacter michiganensis]|uniref:phosphotransferase n=2 Tax=Clavibacter michiganensis TaxID=28447 RepID=UPI003BEF0C45|nr:hypothetical protein [Clavibacter michiganensis subsp. michiganensis]